ncbi:hypothetical protein ACFQZQ_06240 [Lysobacter koreensis]|uniref:EF-hand domain-containing protein n=1 Tax=Lysobacter koreensis TaxID=266122 RepID=A0ABW2YL08_9GAMM
MNRKSHTLLALLLPGLALLAACDRAPSADDAATPPPVATSAPAPAPADPMPPAPMPMPAASPPAAELMFAEMDKNKDGGIAKDELAATDMLFEHFSVADGDGDGKLTEAEVSKHRADMAAAPAQ